MDCQQAKDWIGPLIDGELPPGKAAALLQHTNDCPKCLGALEASRSLVASFESERTVQITPPAEVWRRIETHLDARKRTQPIALRIMRRPMALAASLALLLGAGVFIAVWLNPVSQVARADSVDYRPLLDGLAQDADGSIDRFLQHYQAASLPAETIASQSAPLKFRIPQSLPGKFTLQKSYRLQFGPAAGYAARYLSPTGEPLFVCFHRPVEKTLMGVHRESHCSLAQGSHCVEVGPWQLIHFTDPTTCHCLLSRTTDEGQLRAILAAISTDLPSSAPSP